MNEFERGYEFALESGVAALAGENAAGYIRTVEAAIAKLYEQMGAYEHYMNSPAAQESLKGFIAEEWASGTANVDAAVKNLPQQGSVLHSRGLGSPDVAYAGKFYQLKTMSSPEAIAKALSKTLRYAYHSRAARYSKLSFSEWAEVEGFAGKNPDDLLYGEMHGLVPIDKLEGAKEYCVKRIARAQSRGHDAEVARWEKVRDNLTDRIHSENGVEGRSLTTVDARDKAVAVSNGEKLNPADDGMTTAQLVKMQQVLQQSLKAGATAAALSAALKVAPEIYRAIDYLVNTGGLDREHLAAIGKATGEGAASGFVSGTATAAVTVAAGKGLFGQAIKTAATKAGGPNVIAALVVLTIETCRDTYLVSIGQLSSSEMAHGLARSTFATVCMFAGVAVASLIAPEATIPALIGSIVGGAAGSFAFNPVSSCVLRVCQSSGFTFFGLVDQSFEIPRRLMERLRLQGVAVKTARPDLPVVQTPKLSTPAIAKANVHTLDIAFVERGLVGINKVGYLC